MKRLIIAASAQRDLQEIHDYIANDNTDAASRWIDRLVSRFEDLSALPGIGRKRTKLDPRYRSITEGDYVIFYQTTADDAVEVVRVIHGKRDLGQALTE